MLTGTYLSTHQVGQDGKANVHLSSLLTLPELLQDIGYETALFTPNPFVSEATGLDRGFNHTKSVKAVPESYSPRHEDVLDYWIEGLRRIFQSRAIDLARTKHELKTTENEVLQRHAKRWLKSTRTENSPFFAYAHIPGPHHPYLPNADYVDCFTDDIAFSTEEAYSLVKEIYYGGSDEIKREIATGLDLSHNEWDAIEAMYDATLKHMDQTVEEIVSTARSESDDLILVVVGDHGELFGEHGVIGHNLVLHEKLIRVPMVVSGIPDVVTDEDTMTQQIDLTRTLAEITGVVRDQFEGQDIRDSERKYGVSQYGQADFKAYLEYNQGFDIGRFFEKPYTMVTDGEYKLATNVERTELYRLPDETTDVSELKENHLQRLSGVLKDHDIEWDRNDEYENSEFTESQIEQLKDLGYLS
ncbi:sulfatase [Halobacterium salinarum]|nr:putative sulfatase [Halobacterium salinarum DSM 3754]